MGVEFNGGSRHDRNRCSKVLARTAKTVMKATALNPTPLFRHPDIDACDCDALGDEGGPDLRRL